MQDNQGHFPELATVIVGAMNSAIEIHDSKVNSITNRGSFLEVCLIAYIHKSEGTPGRDPGTGWTQDAILTFGSGTLEGEIGEYPAWLSGGILVIDGEPLDNEIPIPLSRKGNTELKLEIFYNSPVVIRGNEVHLELRGTPTYVENFRTRTHE